MPDEQQKEQTALEKIENNAETNAAIATTLANQDKTSQLSKPLDLTATSDALDKLAAQQPEEAEAAPVVVAPKKEEKAAVPAPVVAAPDPEVEARRKRADEIFKDSPSLPHNASPKSTEAFSSVKLKAAQEISAKESEIEQLKKDKAELETKLSEPIPDDITKELEDHRTWRAKLDVELDPKFKEYDKSISQAHEFIYSQLRKSPSITDDVIAKIKKEGGPENVQMEKLFEAVKDPLIQRLVESKLADIEMAKFNKEQAIKSTKENVGQYLTERQKQWEQSANSHNTETQKELDTFTSSHLKWLTERKADDKATDEEKTATVEYNKFVSGVREHLKAAMTDDSPRMRAIMLTGMAQLLYAQRVNDNVNANFAKEKTAHEETRKQLTEATAKLDKLKNASVSRLRESAAPPGGKLPEAKKDFDTRRAGDALDDIARQVQEERARAANVG